MCTGDTGPYGTYGTATTEASHLKAKMLNFQRASLLREEKNGTDLRGAREANLIAIHGYEERRALLRNGIRFQLFLKPLLVLNVIRLLTILELGSPVIPLILTQSPALHNIPRAPSARGRQVPVARARCPDPRRHRG